MSNFQIAISGVEAGTFGNNTQIPTFTVDARGRITWAANLDVETVLKTRLDDHTRTFDINVRTEELKFRSGRNIGIVFNENREYEISLVHDQLIRGTFEGAFEGSSKGVVLAADNSILVNSADKTFYGNLNTSFIHSSNSLTIETQGEPTVIQTNNIDVASIRGFTDGSNSKAPTLTVRASRGTIDNLTDFQAGDFASQIRFAVGDQNKPTVDKSIVLFLSQLDPTADVTDTSPASNLHILVSAGDNRGSSESSDYHVSTFDNTGLFTTRFLKIHGLDTTAVSNIVPAAGTIIYNESLDKFQGYVNNVGNGLPGWINLH